MHLLNVPWNYRKFYGTHLQKTSGVERGANVTWVFYSGPCDHLAERTAPGLPAGVFRALLPGRTGSGYPVAASQTDSFKKILWEGTCVMACQHAKIHRGGVRVAGRVVSPKIGFIFIQGNFAYTVSFVITCTGGDILAAQKHAYTYTTCSKVVETLCPGRRF